MSVSSERTLVFSARSTKVVGRCTLTSPIDLLQGVVMQQAEQRLQVIRLLLIWQFSAALAVGLPGFLWSSSAAISAMAGGFIVFLPNCYFAWRAFRYRGARAARLIVRSFYAGVTGKILLTAALFVLVFVNLKPLNAPAVFIGFISVQMLNWLVPLFAARQQAI